MKIDLTGRNLCLAGGPGVAFDALAAALQANGAAVTVEGAITVEPPLPDIAVMARAFGLDDAGNAGGEHPDALDRLGDAMHRRGSGRLIVLLSACAAVPSRRFPGASVAAAATLAEVRTLAMRLGPAVLVNAIGCGALTDGSGALVAGHASMLSHVPTGEPGSIDDLVNAVLFLCDPMNSYMTGQMLVVDGGWSAGYGRNF